MKNQRNQSIGDRPGSGRRTFEKASFIFALLLIGLMTATLLASLADLARLALTQWREPSLHLDSWSFVSRDNSSLPSWLFAQHNEHRIVFSKIATVLETEFLRIPPTATSGFEMVGLTGINLLLVYLICRASLQNRIPRLLTFLGCSLILINPWQYENFAWEFQVPWIFINTLVLTATLAVCTRVRSLRQDEQRPFLFLITVLPWIAIYSSGQGFALSAAICIASIFISRQAIVMSLGSTLLACGVYFRLLSYIRPAAHPPLSFNYHYFLSLLFGGHWIGLAMLSLLFVSFLLLTRKPLPQLIGDAVKGRQGILLPGLFAFLFACMTTLSRSTFGVMQASSPRYVTHSSLLGLTIVLLMACCVERLHDQAEGPRRLNREHLFPSLAAICCTIFPLQAIMASNRSSYSDAWEDAQRFSRQTNKEFRCFAAKYTLKAHAITLATHCHSRHPDLPEIQEMYFTNKLPVKPLGWHQKVGDFSILHTENPPFINSSMNHAMESHANDGTWIKLKGWAYQISDPKRQLIIIATYKNSEKIAYLVDRRRNDIAAKHRLANLSTGFDLRIAGEIKGSPLMSISLVGPDSAILIMGSASKSLH